MHINFFSFIKSSDEAVFNFATLSRADGLLMKIIIKMYMKMSATDEADF